MKISTQILLGFAFVILVSVIDSYGNYTLFKKVKTNSEFLASSEVIIRNSGALNKSITDMQSAFRGFLLTADEAFLKPYYAGIASIPSMFKEEYKLVSRSSQQRQRLKQIEGLHRQWIVYANTLINAKRMVLHKSDTGNYYKRLFDNSFRKQFGQKLNEAITAKFKEFDRYEYRLRQSRREVLTQSIQLTNVFSLVFVLSTIAIGIASTLFIVRLISKRINAMVDLARNISSGNFVTLTDTKNDELSSLSESLNQMSVTLNKNIRELETRNNELNQFAYVVSHDLKAPIRGIYNVIQWIQEDLGADLSAEMKKYLNIIPQRISRMEGLIDGLLDYARISREKLVKEEVDASSVVNQIVADIVPAGFNVTIAPLPTFKTERLRLEQVFSNLISNAVKYASSTATKRNINISCKNLENYYEFIVADNGIGIKPEYHERIFVIFQTLRDRHDKESTGVGLAIVKKIIEDQNCNIRVESEAGKGSSFIFTWPKS